MQKGIPTQHLGGAHPLAIAATVALAGVTLVSGQTQLEGIVERLAAIQCIETHVLWDFCGLGLYSSRISSSTIDLSQYECQYVRAEGGNVEWCADPVYELQAVTALPVSCGFQVQSLEVHEQSGTWLQWTGVPCTGRYDVIRGDLPGLRISGSIIDLGRVRCLVNDTTGLSTLDEGHDTDLPEAGRAYFYLVRAHGVTGVTSYGFSSGGLEEVPASHGCRS